MNEPRVVWGEDDFAAVSGWVFAHCINQNTGELMCSQDVWVSAGTGLPAGAFLDAPPQHESGKAIVRNNGSWELVDDLRGATAYNKHTKQHVIIIEIGELPCELTLVAPSSSFDVWSEESAAWVKDEHAEHEFLTEQASSKRSLLLGEAGNEISALIDALDPDVTSEPDESSKSKLLEWKKYRAALAVIDCSSHPVKWPERPQ